MRLAHTIAALGLALGAAACSDSTSPAARKGLAVSFTTANRAPTSVAAQRGSAFAPRFSVTSATSTDTLVVTRVQLVLSKVELASASATCTGAEGDDCSELHLSPVIVDLPLDSAVVAALDVPVPAGTYSRLEAKIDPVRSGDDAPGAAAFLTTNPTFQNVSVRVEGTFDGQPFTYTTSAEAKLELSFNPAMVVDSTGANLTINVDVASWFAGSAGLIDPASAAPGTANGDLVAQNIKRSFRAFEDDDRDGRDDQSGRGGN